jgi:hypothetical protein
VLVHNSSGRGGHKWWSARSLSAIKTAFA